MAALGRWTKRIGLALLCLVLLLTIASWSYEAATNGDVKPASALYPGPFLRVDGTSVAFRRWGRAGSPVVLLGGFVEPSYVWQRTGAALGRTHRVFALDLPPFGYSERNGRYRLRDWVELVRAFDRRLNLDRPVLVGHSLGAAVATGYALSYPRELGGIVLLDGDALSARTVPSWVTSLLVDPYFTSLYRLLTRSEWVVRRGLRTALGPMRPPVDHAFLREWQRPFLVKGSAAAFRKLIGYGIQGFRLADLRGIRTRALVVWGADDHVDEVAAGRRSARALGASFVVLPRAGHLSMLSDPVQLARTLDVFLRH